jgi:hypothetical protein
VVRAGLALLPHLQSPTSRAVRHSGVLHGLKRRIILGGMSGDPNGSAPGGVAFFGGLLTEQQLRRLPSLMRDWPSYVLMGAGVVIVVASLAARWEDGAFHGSDYRWTLAAGCLILIAGVVLNAYTMRVWPQLLHAATQPTAEQEADLQNARGLHATTLQPRSAETHDDGSPLVPRPPVP